MPCLPLPVNQFTDLQLTAYNLFNPSSIYGETIAFCKLEDYVVIINNFINTNTLQMNS